MVDTIKLRYSSISQGWRDAALFCLMALAIAGYYYSPLIWVSGLAGLAFALLCYIRLDLGLLFVILSAPFYRFPKSFDPAQLGVADMLNRSAAISVSLAEFAILICLVAWLARVIRRRRKVEAANAEEVRSWKALVNPVALFFYAATLSLLASEYLRFSLREYRTVVLEPLIFYFLLTDTMTTKRDMSRLLYAFVGLGALVSVVGLYHYYFIGIVEATGGVRRVLAVYHSPNALALFLGRVAPVAITLVLFSLGDVKRKWVWAAASLIILACLYLTYSRGAWLAVACALLFVFALRASRKMVVVAGIMVVLGIVLVALLPQGRVISEATTGQRLHVWRAAVNMIGDHPWLGVGLDNFLYQYPKYMLKEAWAEPNISHPHNILLDFWTRVGILGVAAITWLQVSFWSKGVRLYRRLMGEAKILVLAIMASMVDFLVHGLIDNSYFLIDLAFIFWMTYGLVILMERSYIANLKAGT